MKNEQLRSTLRLLHDELSQTDDVDRATLARLEAVAADIERSLDEREDDESTAVESNAGTLKDLLLKFEADHPQLSVAVGRVADALAAMGI